MSVGPIRIRPIRPEDEALYGEFFAHVSSDDQRLRFFTVAPDLSHRFLARMTQIDYAREMAFVAIAKSTGALLGVVRLVADPDYTRGEYAILVRSDLKGRGLGWSLMQHLIAYAKSERLEELHGSVLTGNTTMLQMCRQLGFTIERGARRCQRAPCRVAADLSWRPFWALTIFSPARKPPSNPGARFRCHSTRPSHHVGVGA